MNIKVGDTVGPIPGSLFHMAGDRWTGKVTRIAILNNDGPVPRGTVEVIISSVENYYLPVGSTEVFPLPGWESIIEIIG